LKVTVVDLQQPSVVLDELTTDALQISFAQAGGQHYAGTEDPMRGAGEFIPDDLVTTAVLLNKLQPGRLFGNLLSHLS